MQVAHSRLQRNFGNAAAQYDTRAEFQHIQTRRVLDAALMLLPENASVLDVGCGTGYFAHAARDKRPGWRVLGVDIARGMCEVAATRCEVLNADAAAMPVASGSFDAAVSSLCYQWIENQEAAFAELSRVLKPGARAVVASLGEGTLSELRACAGASGQSLSLLPMRAIADVLASIRAAGFEITLAEETREVRYYDNVATLMDSMREIGAGNNFSAPATRGIAPSRWAALQREYETRRTHAGIPATWEHQFFILHKPL